MKLSKQSQSKIEEHGRIIARAIDQLKVDKKKSMIRAEERRIKNLESAAEEVLSDNSNKIKL